MMLGAAPIRSRQLCPAAMLVGARRMPMPNTPSEPPAPDFRGLALMLRGRAGVTQRELADHVGVSVRAVQTWEAGLNYPSAQSLQRMIALFLAHGAFNAGRELEEAMALWT